MGNNFSYDSRECNFFKRNCLKKEKKEFSSNYDEYDLYSNTEEESDLFVRFDTYNL